MRKIGEPWDGIGEDRVEILRLCAASPEERSKAARRALTEKESGAERIQALSYLLSWIEPAIVPELVGRLAPGPVRDRVCARLARNGWLPPPQTGELLLMIREPLTRLRAETLRSCADCDPAWLSSLAGLISDHGLDPLDPAGWSALRRLWKANTGNERQVLGRAVIDALSQEGRRAGEDALCVWLNAHLAPRIGAELPDRVQRSTRVREALQRGLILAPGVAAAEIAGR
jgi:hypothetical protein